MSVKSRLGVVARRTRKFGDVASVVSRKAGLGDISRKIKARSQALADLIESAVEESGSKNPIDRAREKSRR
jgi:hypothetical protein